MDKPKNSQKEEVINCAKQFFKNRDEVIDKVMDLIYDNPGLSIFDIVRITCIEPLTIDQAVAYLTDFDYIYVDEKGLLRLKHIRKDDNPFGLRRAMEDL